MHSDSNTGKQTISQAAQVTKLLIPRSQRQAFFWQFTLMTIMGWVVGGIASIGLEKTLLEKIPESLFQEQPLFSLAFRIAATIIFAVIFATDQALVLRQYISPWLWIIATCIGSLLFTQIAEAWKNYIIFVATSSNPLAEDIIVYGILSTFAYNFSAIWLGFCQWLVLRRYVTGAWWWNFIMFIAYSLISIVIVGLSMLQGFIPATHRHDITYLITQGVTALILGVIPAFSFCTLKVKSSQSQP
ncbi:hypothetical protein [Calothrix sp. 336/3]|uniref:hypothetical protein n=1 Tax=Calothrix sp. 336/3 TaxID=1337936 RepID=UPI0004E34886|nr:hypothetical protein [Calothrix sp. 336/3]AKG21740.1 hypothetical protein IJ00_11160 [Calothrix sp. 336/3]